MVKLGSYLVAFEMTPRGLWGWEATDPEGRPVRSPRCRGATTKEECHRRALAAIERHACREEIDGETLRGEVLAAELRNDLKSF